MSRQTQRPGRRSGYQDVAVRVADGPARPSGDLIVRTPDGTPVGAVVDAVRSSLGANADDGAKTFEVPRLGRRLERAERFGSAGIANGDEVRLVAAPEGSGAPETTALQPLVELVMESGPDVGLRRPLSVGTWMVGRLPTCDIQLNDPEASREHMRIDVSAGGVTVTDRGSLNGTWFDEQALSGTRDVTDATMLRIGETRIRIRRVSEATPATRDETDLNFVRPPRIHRPAPPERITLSAPPDAPPPVRMPLAASLAPLVLGIGLWLATKQLTMLLFVALSPVIAVWSYLEDRHSGRRRFKREAKEFRERAAAFAEKAAATLAEEVARRHEEAPDAGEVRRRALERDTSLWERRVGDPDFLGLRVGVATLPRRTVPVIEPGGSDKLRAEVTPQLGEAATVEAVPAIVPFKELGAVGLCGPRATVERLAMAMVTQASVLHSPSDVIVAAALHDGEAEAWDWLKWLPHARSGDLLLGGPQIAVGMGEAGGLLDRIETVVAGRTEQDRLSILGPREIQPWVLLVVDERVVPRRLALVNILEKARDAGVAVLWMGEDRTRIPGACKAVVEVSSSGDQAEIVEAASGARTAKVAVETYTADALHEVAWHLAPLRDAEGASGPAQLPRRLALLELLDMVEADVEALAETWLTGDGAIAAAIGMTEQGIFTLDLRRDGPHALVAGTTGAGKSELLRTFVASLALALPPTRLNFLLVDYKGGSAFRECAGLPHTVGMVTDLNADLAKRALTSLYAEIKRREVLLDDAGAKDLEELRRRSPSEAPPALLIVIDEFATLAKEVPEFVEGVVDVAQRGRSLGVHMVLATQRPGGAVTPTIRANTNLRIALRVANTAESEDVIDSPDAVRIPNAIPGRAYARTGHSELTAFQAAHVSGRSGVAKEGEVVVVPFILGRHAVAQERMGTIHESSDLTHIVALTKAAAERLDLPRQRSPWLPPLPDFLPLDALDPESVRDPVLPRPAIGRVDEPSMQRQRPLLLEPDRIGSILVYGGPGSGKTAALWTVATSLCRLLPPDALHVYGLDFSTGGLRPLTALPHTGAIVGQDEPERIERLIRFLTDEVAARKSRLTASGALDFAQLVRALPEGESVPRILVLLDDYGGFYASFERVQGGMAIDQLTRLVADGRQLGMHFAITTSQRSAIPGALTGSIPWRVILDMASRDDLGILGVDVRGLPETMPPGRAIVEGRLQAQLALLSQDPSPEAQLLALSRLADDLHQRFPDANVPGIGTLPFSVPRASLPTPDRPATAYVGIGDSRLAPLTVDLDDGHLLVIGPFRSGRSTALATISLGLAAAPGGCDLHLLAPRRSPLLDLECWTSVARGQEECASRITEIHDTVSSAAPERPVVIVLDNGEDLAEGPVADQLERIARAGRDGGVRLVAAIERQAARKAYMGWIPEARRDEHGLLLDPNIDMDGDLLGAILPRTPDTFAPGRGYLCRRGEFELLQVAS